MSTLTPATGVVAVVGNPRPASRTRTAAEAVARRVAEITGQPLLSTIDLADLAGELLAPAHPAADAARDRVARAAVVVVATPVYKASYTGLLKAFLDLYGPDGLRGTVAVPLVVSGNPAHSLAGEVHLRPVLVELGAWVPTRALALAEAQLGSLDDAVTAWSDAAAPVLRSLAAAARGTLATDDLTSSGAALEAARS
ncbi:NAD(P)H-dependent oxidoreductase [Cellulomonas fimi]|uniref:NADPH-dependent oxidoreductase n=1 Tax=Cellulomonas fimi TaxID=1708 RepID=A0A7Y0LYB2_CELFI|nr:NAD(P)H-dependent oxidoreductase [Cellulomonas fimi]NMR20320.1 NADPH-dependent oxidoreductase [Cellulomonas fimi]